LAPGVAGPGVIAAEIVEDLESALGVEIEDQSKYVQE